jgi:hypothetical protein
VAVTQLVPLVVLNLNIHYHGHNSQPLCCALGQMMPSPPLHCFFELQFGIIILPSSPRSPEYWFWSGFSANFSYAFHITSCVPSAFHRNPLNSIKTLIFVKRTNNWASNFATVSLLILMLLLTSKHLCEISVLSHTEPTAPPLPKITYQDSHWLSMYLFVVYVTTLSVVQAAELHRVIGWIMHNELERMWKEAVVVQFDTYVKQ